MNASILVVDDDVLVTKLIKIYLNSEGYDVTTLHSGAEMQNIMKQSCASIDLIILDMLLPDTDGITLAREIRRLSDVPIIMLTGKHDSVDKIVALEVGADDYVTKPFEERELLARIRSILRRVGNQTKISEPKNLNDNPDETILDFDGWQFNLSTHTLLSPSQDEVLLTSY